jgi:nucleotide-binding universal stress UspA family protein
MIVVVGYARTPQGEAALRLASEDAEFRGAHLVIVNSSRGDRIVDPALAAPDDIERIESDLARRGVPHEVRRTTGGTAAEDILDVADEVGADRIYIGIKHRSPVGKLITGSDSQRVLLGAECPVVAVKATPA